MMKFLATLALVLLAVTCQAAELELEGQCDPTVKVMDNFNVEKYTGLWYEIYRYEHVYQGAGDCVTATYSLKDDGSVIVDNKMVVRGTQFTILGEAKKAPDAGNTGKMMVTFPTFNKTSPYWVLSTDYDNYSLVYTCTNLPENRKKVTSWILSRTTTLKPQSVLAMNERLVATPELKWDLYKQTNQTESACVISQTGGSTVFTPDVFNKGQHN